MADSDAIRQLGEAARKGFKAPKNFGEARKGALEQMEAMPSPTPAPQENLFAGHMAAPSPSPMASPTAAPGEDDQLQEIADAYHHSNGGSMSLEEAKAALARRSQKTTPQTYPSVER